MPNIFAGFISCLEAVTFFRVSKLTYCRPERQCNLARDRNPAKGKPLLRQGTDGNRLLGGDISLNPDYALQMPNIFAGFISCLEAVTFFRVSKLTYCRPKEPVQFGPRSKPCKRQTAPAAGGTDGNRSRQGIFL